ncbi:uncharacterized protein [Drosophila kikkawai]|uniref:Uncharacterized protein n=1 Tax=Drosophila kikkawai TaxID=30033 RepID=A0A6P4IBK6_DROKI|nr:uncharacterized protein LOC108077470 [Drosophila kikkawai]
MGQGRSAKSVSNSAAFLLILLAQNCGRARSHGRDGLAKLEFSGRARPVYNFAKIYETLGAAQGRGWGQSEFHVFDQLQQDFELQWQRTTTARPFSILQQLDREHEQEAHRLGARPNTSFDILETLYQDQRIYEAKTTTHKPFLVLQKLEDDLIKANRRTTTVKPFKLVSALVEDLIKKDQKAGYLSEKPNHGELEPEHKAELKPESRAKQSQKRRRKRIRRRRKRIRRRRKRTRRRRRKKRKKRRKKRKKKKHKGGKKKKKKGKRKRKKQPKPEHEEHEDHSIFKPAHLIFANPTKQPYYHHHYPSGSPYHPTNQLQVQAIPSALLATLTTKKPKITTTHKPFSKIKYLLRHNSIFKKKKKEYLSHVGQVLYPFVKFVAFFTVLNPFTLGVFLFTLVSPAVFGFLGFVALSVLVKPFLNIVFGVKRNVDAFDRKRWLANKQAEKLKLGLRPVTIHKHYYQQKPVHSAPPVRLRPVGGHWRREDASESPMPPPVSGMRPPPMSPEAPPLRKPQMKLYNPLLPDHRKALDLHHDYG